MAGPVRLGVFDLEQVVGTGTTGAVWRARVRGRGLPAAVKVVSPDHEAAFWTELRAAAPLVHPGVVRLLDAGAVDGDDAAASAGRLASGSRWLAMEWAEDGTLAAAPPFRSWDEVRQLLRELLAALAAVHAQGVVHRDLKPRNVLLGVHGHAGRYALSDFGVALRPGEALRRTVAGTPQYMAPEQLGGSDEQGPPTDLYALGCLAVKALTGHAPFEGRSDEIRHAQLRAPVPPIRPTFPTPPGLDGWVRRLLEKSPSRRFPLAADAAAALDALESPAPRRTAAPIRDDGRTFATFEGAEPDEAAAEDFLPEVPESWRGPDPPAALPNLGLGLWEHRPPPLLGRETEQEALWRALREVRTSRRPRAVVLSGPAGIGKSRLAAWLVERAHETGAAVGLRAVHAPSGGVADGLRGLVGRAIGGSPSDPPRDRVRARLRRWRVDDPAEEEALVALLTGDDRSTRAGERHAVVAKLLERAAGERAVVLWLDDVQWGLDAVQLAQHLLRRELPVLIVLTARDGDPGPERNAIDALSPAVRLPLRPLPDALIRRLVADRLGVDADAARAVADRAVGNPLFAEQMVAGWISQGTLRPTALGLQVVTGTELPEDAAAAWAGRIEQFLKGRSAVDALALEVAATLGVHVDVEEWRAACEPPPSARLADELLAAGIARPEPGGFAFSHHVLRDALLDRARRASRLTVHHWACASALKSDDPWKTERRGLHLVGGGAWKAALGPLYKAATWRIRRGDWRAAEHLLDAREQALGHVAEAGAAQVEQWAERGRLAWMQGRMDEADALQEQAEQAARAGGWKRHLAAALVDRANTAMARGRSELAFVRIEEALALAIELGDGALVPAARQRLAVYCKITGAYARAEAECAEALAGFQARGDGAGVAQCLAVQASLEIRRGEPERAVETLGAAIALAQQEGSQSKVAEFTNTLGDALRKTGRFDEAAEAYARVARIGRAIGWGLALYAEVNLALVRLEQQRFGEARGLLEAALPAARAQRLDMLVCGIHAALLPCAAADRDWERFDGELAATEQLLAKTGFVDPDLARWPMLAGALARAAGDRDRALAALQIAAAQWRAMSRSQELGVTESAIRALGGA
jgi:tetratricopeptide (TPR) repeat protein